MAVLILLDIYNMYIHHPELKVHALFTFILCSSFDFLPRYLPLYLDFTVSLF